MTEKQKKILGVAAIILAIAFMGVIMWFIGIPLVKFVKEPEIFRMWVDGKGIWGRIIFIGMLVFQIIVALIPAEPFELGAGYAFGYIEGTLLCMIGSVIGGALVFIFVKKWGIKLVEVFFPREKIDSIKILQNERKTKALFFMLMLIPGTPKDLISYIAGLTRINLPSWILIITVAKIPSIITSTIGGHALGMQNYLFAAIAMGVTVAISICGYLVYSRYFSKSGKKDKKIQKSREQN